MPFIQLVEFQTDNIKEFNATVDAWVADSGDWRTASRATLAQDRDRPGTYVQIIEFPSYEAAMENSKRPETAAFAARLSALCSGPPTFRNLDVERQEEM
jgi:quinol monooxygenase YgiN